MKMDRRTFIGALAAALPLARISSAAVAAQPSIGLQVYTVRRQMEKDFEGTLKKVAALGIKDVEFAGHRPASRAARRYRESGIVSGARRCP